MQADKPAGANGRPRALGSLLAVMLLLLSESLYGDGPGQLQAQTRTNQTVVLTGEIRDKLENIRQQLIISARTAQAHEAVVNQAEKRLAILKARHSDRAHYLSELRAKLGSLTAAMQRLARRPPEAILTSARPPLDTARAMMLVRYLVPNFKHEADLIQGELTKLDALNHQIWTEQDRFQAAIQALEKRRDQLNQLIERKNTLWVAMSRATQPSADDRNQLARSATTLGELFVALKKHGRSQATAAGRLQTLIETERPTAEQPGAQVRRPAKHAPHATIHTRPSEQTAVAPTTPTPSASIATVPQAGSFAANKGRITFPTIGRLVGRFGETDVVGLAAKGITVQTRPNAPVVASHDGKVIYAGPFRGYGRIIIIEHGQGFLTLLAGLGRVDVQTGQGLLAGEPVGTMKNAKTIGDVKSRHLYIELRQDGAPVDPLAWLSTQRDTAIQ